MKSPSATIGIFVGLVVCLAALTGIGIFLPQADIAATQTLQIPKPVFAAVVALGTLVMYGGLGYLGLVLSQKVGFAGLWPKEIPLSRRLLIPTLVGAILGVFFILADGLLSQWHPFGKLPHPPFPTSLVASATAGIGEELIFRLFFISFWVWLVSDILLKKRWKTPIFWIVAVMSAFAFASAHLPSLMFLFGMKSPGDVPPALMAELLLINGTLSIIAAYYMKTCGLIAAISVHFWADVIWHVVWGPMA